jgi:hypothetical protein
MRLAIETLQTPTSMSGTPHFPSCQAFHMKILPTLLLLCTALLTSCGSSMHSRMEKWGWTDVNPDPGPRFGDHTTPPPPPPVAVTPAGPAKISIGSGNNPSIGTATSHIDSKALPPPPKQSNTPEFQLPKN